MSLTSTSNSTPFTRCIENEDARECRASLCPMSRLHSTKVKVSGILQFCWDICSFLRFGWEQPGFAFYRTKTTV